VVFVIVVIVMVVSVRSSILFISSKHKDDHTEGNFGPIGAVQMSTKSKLNLNRVDMPKQSPEVRNQLQEVAWATQSWQRRPADASSARSPNALKDALWAWISQSSSGLCETAICQRP
jgi:hypothetical protein